MTEEERALLLEVARTLTKLCYDPKTGPMKQEGQRIAKAAIRVQELQNSYLKPRNDFSA